MRGLALLAVLALLPCLAPKKEKHMGLTLRAAGLYTQPSRLSEVPEGALERANDVVIERDGVISPRRKLTPGTLTAAGEFAPVRDVVPFAGKLVLHASTSPVEGPLEQADEGATDAVATPILNEAGVAEEALPPLSAPASAHASWAQAGGELFLTSADGVKRIGTDMVLRTAGVPPPLALHSYVLNPGTVTPLDAGKAAAYRFTLVTDDSLGNEMESEPSDRVVVLNTDAAARYAVLTATLPAGTTTAFRVRLYRTRVAAGATQTGDNMGLVYERAIDASDISGGTVSIGDISPDAAIGRALYTNDLQQGIAQANAAPPFAYVLGEWRGHMLYGNVRTAQSLQLRVIGTAATGNTLTIGDLALTVGAGPTDLPTCDGSAAQIIAFAQALVDRVNQLSATLRAQYLSGDSDWPGILSISERSVTETSAAFTVSSVGMQPFDLSLPATSSADLLPARVMASKSGQPWAVPEFNYWDVGDGTASVLAIASLRDTAFVFTDKGLYRSTGREVGNLDFEEHDKNAILVAPRSVQQLNGELYAWTTQGVVRINEGGVEVVSRAIEPDLARLVANFSTENRARAFGVAQEMDKRYTLWVSDDAVTPWAPEAFVFNAATQAWTKRTDNARCAAVGKGGALVVGSADAARLDREARTLAPSDSEGVAVDVLWVESADGMPNTEKQWTEMSLLYEKPISPDVTLVCRPDGAAEVEVPLSDTESTTESTTIIPRECQRATRLAVGFKHTVAAGEDFQVLGVEVTARPYERKGKR